MRAPSARRYAEKLRTRLLADADALRAARTKASLDQWLAQHELDPTTRMNYESQIRRYLTPNLERSAAAVLGQRPAAPSLVKQADFGALAGGRAEKVWAPITCGDDATSVCHNVPKRMTGADRCGTASRVDVPDPKCLVVADGGQPATVRGCCQRSHLIGVSRVDVAGLTGVRVPDPHRSVLAGGSQPITAWCDYQRFGCSGVAS
jgi:hypothetical protein